MRVLACLALLFASGCSQQQGSDIVSQFRQGKPQEFLQTSVDRMATLAMHDNLESLWRRCQRVAAELDATVALIGILPSNGGHHDCVIIPTKLEHMKHTRSCTL